MASLDILDKMQKGMSYDIISYITRFNNFYNSSFNTLVSYWKSTNGTIDPSIITEFEYLYNSYNNVINAFQQKTNAGVNDLDYFDFAEYLADIKQALGIIKNLPKYLKTSTNYVDVFQDPVINYFVNEGDTLESIAQKFYGDSEMFGLIMDYNGLSYTDVNSSTWIGLLIYIPAKRTLVSNVEGIIDGLIGLNVLGRDINSTFAIVNNDIATVDFEDCFMQSVNNLVANIPLNSIPEYPNIGSISSKIIGSDLGSLSLPMVINEITSNMRLDSTISSFTVNNIVIQDDAMLIYYSVKSILGTQFSDVTPLKNYLN